MGCESVGCCEHCNEPSCSINCCEHLLVDAVSCPTYSQIFMFVRQCSRDGSNCDVDYYVIRQYEALSRYS
jgi:hypothetical protein